MEVTVTGFLTFIYQDVKRLYILFAHYRPVLFFLGQDYQLATFLKLTVPSQNKKGLDKAVCMFTRGPWCAPQRFASHLNG